MIKLICNKCNLEYLSKYSDRRFCSRACYWEAKVGTKQSDIHKERISSALRGKPKSPEHVKNASDAHRGTIHHSYRNENHHGWKGKDVGYCAIHDWVKRRKGKPEACERCKKEVKLLHLANISNKYKRDINDYEYLCVKCHSKLDKDRRSPWKSDRNESNNKVNFRFRQ